MNEEKFIIQLEPEAQTLTEQTWHDGQAIQYADIKSKVKNETASSKVAAAPDGVTTKLAARKNHGGKWVGLCAMFGSNYEAVALYRVSLGIMLLIELVTRFKYLHPFYSDDG